LKVQLLVLVAFSRATLSRFYVCYLNIRSTRQRSQLGHYATSRKVAVSIPDEVIGFFPIDIIFPAAL
jgi:hypothetical protein